VALVLGQPCFLALQRIADGATTAEELDIYRNVTATVPGSKRDAAPVPLLPAYRVEDLPRVFAEADRHFRELRERVMVDTRTRSSMRRSRRSCRGRCGVGRATGRGDARGHRLAFEAARLARAVRPGRPRLARPARAATFPTG